MLVISFLLDCSHWKNSWIPEISENIFKMRCFRYCWLLYSDTKTTWPSSNLYSRHGRTIRGMDEKYAVIKKIWLWLLWFRLIYLTCLIRWFRAINLLWTYTGNRYFLVITTQVECLWCFSIHRVSYQLRIKYNIFNSFSRE